MKSITLQTARARKIMCVLGTILGLLLFSFALFAQGGFGRILGTVTDQTGAVVAGATVSIIDTQRGLARTLTTDQAGEYNAPTLIPGTYTVRVQANGFQTLNRENVVLEVGQEVRVDLTPQPGSQTQTVTVTEAVPLVDTASATLGGTLSNADINDLPLNGRNYQSLMALRPGVVVQPGGGPWTQSTNNIRPDETAWMIEGILNASFNDARPIANFNSPFTDAATILPVDAIQEFDLQENPKAEYGWKPGAVVNVGIRSGTNSYHGSAYAFGRDVDWDARNFFNPGPAGACPSCGDKLPTQLEQFGAVVGGPVKKDKLFFFGGYEGLRSSVGNVFVGTAPATGSTSPQHSLVGAINALQAAGVPLSPVSLKIAGCTVGPIACTGGLWSGLSPNSTSYTSTFPNTNVSDNEIAKVDYRINSKHMLNGMYWNGNYNGLGEDSTLVNPAFEFQAHIRAVTSVINEVWTPTSSLVNEARFGTNRITFIQIPGDVNVLADGSGLTGGKGYPINTGVTTSGGLPNINITGFAPLGTAHQRPSFTGPNPYYVYQDNVSYLRGKHAFKFGGDFTHIVVSTVAGDTSRGRIDFLGGNTPGLTTCAGVSCPLEDFFAGNPSRGFLLAGKRTRELDWRAYSGFFQDDWRILPKLMLNLGLRYEYKSPVKEANNLWGNFDAARGLVQQGQQGVGDTLWKPDRKDFSPRVGFAWDVTGKGTTVVRGGASIIYSTITAGIFLAQLSLQNTPSTNLNAVPTGACATPVVVGVPCPQIVDPGAPGGGIQLASAKIPGSKLNWNGVVFPGGAGISCTAAVPCNVMGVDPNLKTPYIGNWNFGVQHVITTNLSLEVGYVGNHGFNLIGFRDANQCAPDPTGNCVRPYAQFPYLGFINQATNYAYSNYNSLQTTLTKRLSNGLNFTAGYTYGHGLDNGSLNRFGYLPQNSNNTKAEYGSSDFDIRHRFTLTAGYAIPGKKGFGQLLEGWKINSILMLHSSQPWLISDRANNFSGAGDNADRWNFIGNPSDFKSGSSSIPYCTGPGAGGCSLTSGVSGIQSFFSPSESTAMWGQCMAAAPDQTTLNTGGCYVKGKSVMVPPKAGTFGTMGRNIFRDSGFKNLDFSVFKNFRFKERLNAEFRVEIFNLFNHPLVANPYGSSANYGGGNDPGGLPSTFGCGCATYDVAAGNPLIGSGGGRDIQLGLKLTF
jgi:hypothetical protein